MLSREDLTSQMKRSLATNQEASQKKVEQIQFAASEYARTVMELEILLPLLITGLEKVGLGIQELRFTQAAHPNREPKLLLVNVSAVAVSGKFKFIKFGGYDSRGGGRNRKQLEGSAHRLEQHMLNVSGIRVSVNPSSLEIHDGGGEVRDVKTVLITFTIA